MAIYLLEKALRSRPDAKIAISIRERLKSLQPKLTIKAKCKNCGRLYIQKKRGYKKYPLCYACYQKKFAKIISINCMINP